jgi:hypothetical protein
MALLLVVLGIVLLILGWFWIGVACVVVGLVLWRAWSAAPYSYGSWRGRGAPPP